MGLLKYELTDYTIFTNPSKMDLSGICKMALLSKDKTHEIKLDEVCYRIIIE